MTMLLTVMKIPSASPTQDSQIPATHILFMRCPLFRVSNAKRMPRAPAGMDSSPVQHNTREQMPQTIEAIDKPCILDRSVVYFDSFRYSDSDYNP